MRKVTLAGARVSCGMTQDDLADKLGVSRSTVNAWETGKTEIKTVYLLAFCKATGFDEDQLTLCSESPQIVD